MAQTRREIEAVLTAAGMHPRHRFGQNFMIDPNLVRVISDAGGIEPGDVVIEVGPGTGTLTEEILERIGAGGRLVAVEIDRDLAAALRQRFAGEVGEGRVAVIEGDAMAGKHGLHPELLAAITAGKAGGGRVRLVANLPYNIASPLVVELLLAGVDVLAFTVQKEVADRLRAGPAQGKEYGPLSVVVQTLADVQVLRTIGPAAFWPRPKIASALVRIRRRDVIPELQGRERDFGRFVTGVFSQRRKTLRKALAPLINEPAPALLAAGLTGEERPEQVDPQTLLRLYLAGGAPGERAEAAADDPGSMIAS